MIDQELRVELKDDIYRFIHGQMKQDEWMDSFCFRYSATEDRGVHEIANICLRLFGRSAEGVLEAMDTNPGFDDSEQVLISRMILFLRSSREYDWPRELVRPSRRLITGLIVFLSLPVFMGLLLWALPVQISTSDEFATWLALFGIAGMFASLCLVCMPRKKPPTIKQEGRVCPFEGDLWPFRRWQDLNEAACQCNDASPLHSGEQSNRIR